MLVELSRMQKQLEWGLKDPEQVLDAFLIK